MQRAFGLNIPQTLEDICDPTRLALVVYDMQVGIVKQIENGQQITDKVVQVLEAARQVGNSRLFHAPHVTTEGTDGGISVPHGDGLATGEIGRRGQALVLAGRAGIPFDSGDESAAERSIFDKISMSAFEGTPLDMALRDCGIDAFAIVGIAMEIGIEPTVRHGADLGYIPVVVKDACGFGHRDAADRSIASLEFAGDALLTNVETICAQFRRDHSSKPKPLHG